jgi:hypothetical protein
MQTNRREATELNKKVRKRTNKPKKLEGNKSLDKGRIKKYRKQKQN